jgi:hypothetical protein
MSMKRREFFVLSANGLAAAAGMALTSCGSESLRTSNLSGNDEVKDIQTRAGGIIGGVLPKQLGIYEGSHFHTFSLTVEHYNQLLQGVVVKLKSDVSQGHQHIVTIDPRSQPSFEVVDVVPYDRRFEPGQFTAETVTAEAILAAEPVTVYFDEGSHRHALNLSTQHLCALRAGVTLDLDTETVSGHFHPLRLDPS